MVTFAVSFSTTRSTGNLRMRPGAERADLPASDGSASRRAQGLLRGLWRTRHAGLGLRDGYLHAFPQVGLRRALRRLYQSQDDPGSSRRGLAVLDASLERAHPVRCQTAGLEEGAGAISEREPDGHNERQL